MRKFLEVHTTTGSRAEAERIAEKLIDERVAACVQILGPIWSVYRWKGAVASSKEWLCIMKTREDLFNTLQEIITGLHSYEVPEIIAVQVDGGSTPYLSWLQDELRGK